MVNTIRVRVDGGLQTGSLSLYIVQFFVFVWVVMGEINFTLCWMLMARVHAQRGGWVVELL